MAKGTPVGEPAIQQPTPAGGRPSPEEIAIEQVKLDKRPKMKTGQPDMDALLTQLMEQGMSRYDAMKVVREQIFKQVKRSTTPQERAAGMKVDLTKHG